MGVLDEPLKETLASIKMDPEVRIKTKHYLEDLLAKFTSRLKSKDKLFRVLYQKTFYGGSFYDNLKVGAPDEFDVDLLLSFPKLTQPAVYYKQSHTGFVSAKLTKYNDFQRNTKQSKDYAIDFRRKLLDDDDFLDSKKTIQWMQNIVDKALRDFSYFQNFTISRKSSGPAVTLTVANPHEEVNFDVDLVPCFVFEGSEWPGNFKKPEGFNDLRCVDKTFFIVPKPSYFGLASERLWRLSFQKQERKMLKSKTERLRPCIRLLKHLRDIYNLDCIKSYFIKTVGLWEIEARGQRFWSEASLSEVFLNLLRELQESVREKIKYYWDEKRDLIEDVRIEERCNISNFLQSVIKKLEQSTDGHEVYHIFNPDSSLCSSSSEDLSFSSTSREDLSLSGTSKEDLSLSSTSREDLSFSSTSRDDLSLSSTSREDLSLSCTSKEDLSFSSTSREDLSLSSTSREDLSFPSTSREVLSSSSTSSGDLSFSSTLRKRARKN